MHTANEILDKIIALKSLKNDTALAKMFNVKPTTVSNWRKRSTIPYDIIVSFCENEGWSLNWLLTGKVETRYMEPDKINGTIETKTVLRSRRQEGGSHMYGPYPPYDLRDSNKTLKERKADLLRKGSVEEGGHAELLEISQGKASPEEILGQDFTYIPQVSGRISAGTGFAPGNSIEMRVAFRKEWIARKGNAKDMVLIKVSGDSMEPTLLNGDLVLIDRGRNYLEPQGGVYAIALDDVIMIKRVQPTGDRVRIISDNRMYEPFEVKADQIRINGKVIWFARELER